MRFCKHRLQLPTVSAARTHLPWLPRPSDRPEHRPEIRTATVRPPALSNAAVLRAITAPGSTPKQILSVYSQAARQPGFRHDYPTYQALIPALALRRRFRAAALLLSRMRREGLRPGPALLLPLLDACSAADLPTAAAVRLLLSSPPSERAFSALVGTLLATGRLEAARSLLSDGELGFPIRVQHYIGVVKAYCDRGSVGSAVELLDLMASRGSVPDVYCYGSLIRSLCRGGGGDSLDGAFAVADQMRRGGREPDAVVWNTLVHGCVLAGEVGRAEQVVVEMERRGVGRDAGTYNALITGICDQRFIEDGIRVFNCMVERGVLPDVITFSTLMGRLGKEGRVLECNALLGKMLKMRVLLDAACCRILFGVYYKNRMLTDALVVLRVMKSDESLDGGEIGSRMVADCYGEFGGFAEEGPHRNEG